MRIENQVKSQLKVLILGNSITYHAPNAELGWTGNWGMAASAPDKDFVSVLLKKLTDAKRYEALALDAQNIAVWERDFNADLSQFTKIANKKYDLIIVRLGENVDNKAASFKDYERALNAMIGHYKTAGTKVIITGTVWNAPEKDRIHEKVAKDNGYTYVSMLDFQSNKANYAYGQFKNQGVSAHPSDIGMRSIAELLYKIVIALY